MRMLCTINKIRLKAEPIKYAPMFEKHALVYEIILI